jgi:pimeloyl-ACP methyl ester carboxylesterase
MKLNNTISIHYHKAKVWGPDDGVPVLALHGWQDNAGSFDTLAPHLLPSKIRLVCLDFCGNHARFNNNCW